MASFTINSFTTTAENLVSGEIGFVGAAGSMYVTGTAVALAPVATPTSLINLGAITATSTGVYVVGSADATITNAGVIAAIDNEVFYISSTATTYINNSGSILGNGFNGDGIISYGALHLNNSGVISSLLDDAVQIETAFGVSSYIQNSGVISGGGAFLNAILGGGGNETLVNSGTINGFVKLEDGSDSINNGGSIVGNVFLEAGDDSYFGSGTVSGSVDGGAGNDTVTGSQGADNFIGGTGQDRLYGGAGDDLLAGGADRDRIFGGSGVDQITGDQGNDILFGGAGQDYFVYNAISDSVQGGLTDVIGDFERGLDKINISELSASDFQFMGTGGFAGGGAASVKYLVNAGNGATIVQIDVDGNGTSDMRFAVANLPSGLDASDFIL